MCVEAHTKDTCIPEGVTTALVAKPVSDWPRRLAWAVFATGALSNLIGQMRLVVTPMTRRCEPVQVDDSYNLILKAEEMRSCFRQDCPALNDLREQLFAPAGIPTVTFGRSRQIQRVFSVYNPAHSFLLCLLRAPVGSWKAAYWTACAVGCGLTAAAMAWWLAVVWGPGAAGMALILLSMSVFIGHGFHYVVPSNMALGVAFAAWAAAMSPGRIPLWGVPLGAGLAVGLHPVGRIYALLSLVFYWLSGERRRRRLLFTGAVTIAFAALPSGLPLVFSRPFFGIVADPPAPGVSYWEQVLASFDLLRIAYQRAFCVYPYTSAPAVALMIAGLVVAPAARRLRVLGVTLALGVLAVASPLYVRPHAPANLALRAWVPFAVALFGSMGMALWALAEGLGRNARLMWRREFGPVFGLPWGLAPRVWGMAGLIVAMGGIAIVFRQYAADRLRWQVQAIEGVVEHHPFRLDSAQPAALMARSKPGDAVLYAHEIPLYFFLAQGALRRGAVAAWTLATGEEKRRWIGENKNLRFVAAINPRYALPIAREDGLLLKPGEEIVLRSQGPGPLPVREVLARGLAPCAMEAELWPEDDISTTAAKRVFEAPIEKPQWLSLFEEGDGRPRVRMVKLSARGPGTIEIMGLRGGGGEHVGLWPWDEPVALSYAPPQKAPLTLQFSTAALCPELGRPLRVLMDSGSTVLAEIPRTARADNLVPPAKPLADR